MVGAPVINLKGESERLVGKNFGYASSEAYPNFDATSPFGPDR
jgi:hypothetical protein